jgi:hypothetical protein
VAAVRLVTPPKGTRIVQADSGSDSDSKSRRQSAVEADQVSTPIPRSGASRRKECPLFISAGAYSGGRRRRVGADSLSQTVYRNDFLILVRNLGIGIGN